MKRMQDLQPKIEELKKKYKDNPQKLNKETLELYKTYKINPLGGCLPLFFQLPVFIALYQTFFRFIELKGAHFLWIKDLSLPDRAFVLPFSFPFTLPVLHELSQGYVNILPILYMILAVFQQKYTMGQAGGQQQKSMGMFFVIFIGVIFYDFPACLILYWLIQQFFTFLYQSRVSKASQAV
jgi:YidC/Oxa1 family membrane protein insertase